MYIFPVICKYISKLSFTYGKSPCRSIYHSVFLFSKKRRETRRQGELYISHQGSITYNIQHFFSAGNHRRSFGCQISSDGYWQYFSNKFLKRSRNKAKIKNLIQATYFRYNFYVWQKGFEGFFPQGDRKFRRLSEKLEHIFPEYLFRVRRKNV